MQGGWEDISVMFDTLPVPTVDPCLRAGCRFAPYDLSSNLQAVKCQSSLVITFNENKLGISI